MQERIEQYAIEVLRAIRQSDPNISAGAWVDPYTLAHQAGMSTDSAYHELAIEYLESEGALEWTAESGRVVANPIYRLTRRGLEMAGET
jgi:hypothetical protein